MFLCVARNPGFVNLGSHSLSASTPLLIFLLSLPPPKQTFFYVTGWADIHYPSCLSRRGGGGIKYVYPVGGGEG